MSSTQVFSCVADGVPVPGFTPSGRRYSPLEYLLRETEQLHGKIRRYTSPDEHAFYPDDLPPLVLPPITYATVCFPAGQKSCLQCLKVLLLSFETLTAQAGTWGTKFFLLAAPVKMHQDLTN